LLKSELKQGFAGDLQLLALLGSGKRCSTRSTREHTDASSCSSPAIPPMSAPSPAPPITFPAVFLPSPLPLTSYVLVSSG